jgi:ribose transport system permease protein
MTRSTRRATPSSPSATDNDLRRDAVAAWTERLEVDAMSSENPPRLQPTPGLPGRQAPAVPRPRLSSLKETARRLLPRSYLLIVLALTVVVGSIVSDSFLTVFNVKNILITASVVSVLAVGQFFVIVTGGIDLSVGSVVAFATVLTAILLREGFSTGESIPLILLACAAIGSVNGLLVVYAGITPFIATLATLSIVKGFSYIIQSGTLIQIENQSFLNLFNVQVAGIPRPVIIFVVVMLVAALVTKFTTFGRQLYAIGGNPEAARLSGLPLRRNLVSVYALCSGLAGVAGLMLSAQLQQGSSLVGTGYELDSIAAVVVGGASLFGGTGDPISAVVGGLIIGTLLNIMNLLGVASETQLIIRGGVILVAVYFTTGAGLRALQKVGGALRSRRRPGGEASPAAPAPTGGEAA